MYTGWRLRKSRMKSGMGMYCLVGGWYSVAMIMSPDVVCICTAIMSDMKSSITLWEMLFLTAIAVPSLAVLVVFFLCTMKLYSFKDSSSLTPWLLSRIMSEFSLLYRFDSSNLLFLQCSTLCWITVIVFMVFFLVFYLMGVTFSSVYRRLVFWSVPTVSFCDCFHLGHGWSWVVGVSGACFAVWCGVVGSV